MSRAERGRPIPELRVTPDKYLPHRYAGASGDFNPIHIDPEFAKAVGLPSNILHGLYMMGLVARANAAARRRRPAGAEAALGPVPRDGRARDRRSSSPGTVKSVDGDRVVIDTVAAQGDNQIIRNAEAEARSSSGLRAEAGARRPLPRMSVDAFRAPGADSAGWSSMRIWRRRSPLPSKEIAEKPEVEWGPSTVRAELAALEAAGYLTHPHTSAGRVPTDAGYRRYVDMLRSASVGLPAAPRGREVRAMRSWLAGHRPGGDGAAAGWRRRSTGSRCCACSRRVVVIAIASTGRRQAVFDSTAVDPAGRVGLELPERVLSGWRRRRMIADRLAGPELAGEASSSRPARLHRARRRRDDLYMDGAALLSDPLATCPRDELMTALGAPGWERSVFLWIGGENPQPELRSVSVVGANYGLAHRNLGAVGVVGPLRMDYATAIASVRGAARELSRYCETVYDG